MDQTKQEQTPKKTAFVRLNRNCTKELMALPFIIPPQNYIFSRNNPFYGFFSTLETKKKKFTKPH